MNVGKSLAVLALGGAGVLATGCGTQVAMAGSTTASLTAAVTQTTAQTARIAVTTSMQMQGMTMSFTESGAFDFAHSRGTLSMSNPVGLTEVFVSAKTYIKLPTSAGMSLPKGKSWIDADTGMPGNLGASTLGGILPSPLTGGNDNPADLLASLTAISGSIAKQGTSTIRSVPVTEYRVNIDPAKAEARVPSWDRASFQEFAQGLGTGTIPVDVWVDSQNLVRQMQVTQHLPGDSGTPAGSGPPGDSGTPATVVTQTIDFYDFGVPVRVSAPPAAEVASLPQVITGGSPAGTPSTSGSSAGMSGPGGPAAPPPVSGTLSPTEAAAAEQVVRAFWTALAGNDPAAAAQTVPPAQQSCVRSLLGSGPKMTVTSFRIVSAQPAGNGRATVRFTVQVNATLDGTTIPVLPPGSQGQDWLVTTEQAGHWYVDLTSASDFMFSGACG